MLYSITGNNREADYVGIVEKIKNGIIYTVEGNSSDSCRENYYAVGYMRSWNTVVETMKKSL